MAAELKCFFDEECTLEYMVNGSGTYDVLLAPPEGLNGSTGETSVVTIYLRNCGERAALHTTMSIMTDNSSVIRPMTDPFIGDLLPREIKPITFLVMAAAGANYTVYYPTIYFDYYTLPDIDEDHFNPYTALRYLAKEFACDCPDYLPLSEQQLNAIFSINSGLSIKDYDIDKSGDLELNELQRIMKEMDHCSYTTCELNNFDAVDILRILNEV